jgi:replicative DNA helicase Mcm
LLRKYVAFAKRNVKPRLTPEASEKIQNYYVELRKTGLRQGATPITPRQIEGLVRLAEASAKTRLADTVDFRDAEIAISLLNFMLTSLAMDRGGRLDIGIIDTGFSREKVEKQNAIMNIVRKLEQDETVAQMKRVYEETAKLGIDANTTQRYVNELERSGDLYVPKPGTVKIVRHENE